MRLVTTGVIEIDAYVLAARRDTVEQWVTTTNQQRAYLQIVFSGEIDLFADRDCAISLAPTERFTTQVKADRLSPKRLGSWLLSVTPDGRTNPEILHT